jgi:putative transcription factor
MPSGPSLQSAQDWEPVVWAKAVPKGKASKSAAEVNAARRSGVGVDTEKKLHLVHGGTNKSAHSGAGANAKKLDETHGETFRHDIVSHDFKMALQQARTAKKMSQAQLAQAINEKNTVINEYESGKAIPNGQIINKLNRALGVRLPKAKS